jgi:phosphatidylserine decarboxylase
MTENCPNRRKIATLPENIRSVQPGSGVCYRLELAWGGWRRWWLKHFRSGYVKKMAERRRGSVDGTPHEILDPRDLKFCRNLCTCEWNAADDRFGWREKLPFARWGLAELQIMGWPLLAATILTLVLLWPSAWAALAIVPGVLLGLVVYFFRDPPRDVPQEAGLIVSPADGKIAEITRLDHDEFIGGPAVRIGIFLSIFNVHLNRAPVESRVIEVRYQPGLFLNAIRADSAWRNENMWIGLEEEQSPHRPMVVRQISGQFARRIVCGLRPGEILPRGHKFGMIKLGSRTELILPYSEDLKIAVEVGQKVKAGLTVMARWQ